MKEQNVFRSTNPNAPGLVIATGGMPDLGGVQQQIDQLRNQVGAGADYTQPGNPLTTVYAEYTTATAQVFAHNTAVIVNFDTKVRDTHNAVTVGAAWAFRAPLTGRYIVVPRILFDASADWAAGETAALSALINGVAARVLDTITGSGYAGASTYAKLAYPSVFWLNAGQSLSIRAQQTSGVSQALIANALHNWITIAYLG